MDVALSGLDLMNAETNRSYLFFLLAAICIVLLVLSSTGQLAPVENVLARVAKPFLVVFNGIGRQINNVVTTARDLATLRSRNQQLQAMVDTLTIENLRLKEVETENAEIRKLLQFRQLNPTYDYRGSQVIARVISPGSSNYLKTLRIDLGSEHGIEPGMPVVTERGLVGRIHKVGPVSSTVLLITDPSSGVQAFTQRYHVVGVVVGRAGDMPLMDYIPQGEDISVGDTVITSGMGGNFPKNLVIGQVVEVRQRDYEMFQQAILRPTVNFNRLEFVLVITNFKPLPGQPDVESVG